MSINKGTCKFYVSIEKPECGVKSEGAIVTRLSDGGKATVELCKEHLKQHHSALAESARRRLERKSESEGTTEYLVKGGVTRL